LVDSYEIQKGGHAIEGDIDATIFNKVAVTIPQWLTFKLFEVDAKLAPVNLGP
jgi:hypothetical protein